MTHEATAFEALKSGLPLIGSPITQVKTPRLVNGHLERLGLKTRMVPLDIAPTRVSTFFDLLRNTPTAIGCSVTIPHKVAAYENMDDVTDRAEALGVVNTVRRTSKGALVGDMTDGIAMKTALTSIGAHFERKGALVVGAAGGAGRAICYALAQSGVKTLALQDLDVDSLVEFAAVLRCKFPELCITHNLSAHRWDIAINASPIGMLNRDDIPFSTDLLASGCFVGDAVTGITETALILTARRKGLKAVDGQAMATHQIANQLRHWGI